MINNITPSVGMQTEKMNRKMKKTIGIRHAKMKMTKMKKVNRMTAPRLIKDYKSNNITETPTLWTNNTCRRTWIFSVLRPRALTIA